VKPEIKAQEIAGRTVLVVDEGREDRSVAMLLQQNGSQVQVLSYAEGPPGTTEEELRGRLGAAHIEGTIESWSPPTKAPWDGLFVLVPPDEWPGIPVLDAWHFLGRAPNTNGLVAIVSLMQIDGKAWLHLSVSRRSRTPSYEDLVRTRSVLLSVDAPVYFVLPKGTEHVDFHPHCLHLWQPVAHDPFPDPLRERMNSVGPRGGR
jgi:hypothetical protein